MPEFTVELAVGDVLIIGNRTLTVIDIEGLEVHFRVDDELSALPGSPLREEAESQTAQPKSFRPKAK